MSRGITGMLTVPRLAWSLWALSVTLTAFALLLLVLNLSAKLRNETDLGTLSSDILTAVRDTMQPEHTSLWLRDQVERASQETRS